MSLRNTAFSYLVVIIFKWVKDKWAVFIKTSRRDDLGKEINFLKKGHGLRN